MQVETATLSLIGHREENQDRVGLASRENSLFAAVVDGMGGHTGGAEAAELALDTMIGLFEEMSLPVFDPRDFLRKCLKTAHKALVDMGSGLAVSMRPRATSAITLIQKDQAYWAHVGDARVYQLRNQKVHHRTRDHSHIEVLLREGLITEEEYREHPLRNYVEFCLGGEQSNLKMSIAGARQLDRGDVILLCSDGLWSGSDDGKIAAAFPTGFAELDLQAKLGELLEGAVAAEAPRSDNTTAAAIHWLST